MVRMEVGEGEGTDRGPEQAEAVSQIVLMPCSVPRRGAASLRRQEMSRSRRKRRRNLVDRGNRSGAPSTMRLIPAGGCPIRRARGPRPTLAQNERDDPSAMAHTVLLGLTGMPQGCMGPPSSRPCRPWSRDAPGQGSSPESLMMMASRGLRGKREKAPVCCAPDRQTTSSLASIGFILALCHRLSFAVSSIPSKPNSLLCLAVCSYTAGTPHPDHC